MRDAASDLYFYLYLTLSRWAVQLCAVSWAAVQVSEVRCERRSLGARDEETTIHSV